MLLSSEILSGVTDDRVLLRWAVLRALRMVAACTNFDTNRGPSRSMKKKPTRIKQQHICLSLRNTYVQFWIDCQVEGLFVAQVGLLMRTLEPRP